MHRLIDIDTFLKNCSRAIRFSDKKFIQDLNVIRQKKLLISIAGHEYLNYIFAIKMQDCNQ